ncbi:MAG: 4-hydroxy-tetrahydrodipicolinate reductase [Candidatus Omnitrophota bacterium]
MVKVVVSGCCGKMGARIIALAALDKTLKLTGAVEIAGHPKIGKDIGEVLGLGAMNVKITDDLSALKEADCLIEFTSPSATILHLKDAEKYKKPVVIGTTGLSAAETAEIQAAAKVIPVLFSPNMSVGVNAVFDIAGEIAKKLGDDYRVEVLEAHHIHKKDAPSGTAKKIIEIIAAAKGVKVQDIPVHAIRAGDIVGDHTVIYCGNGERIELTHRAHSRDTFASGALRAVKFIAGKKPGFYTMADALKG